MILGELMLGVGNGLFQSPSNMGVLSEVDSSHLGIAGGMLALARNTGMIMGITMAINIVEIFKSYFVQLQLTQPFLISYQFTLRTIAICAVICTLCAYFAYKNEKNIYKQKS